MFQQTSRLQWSRISNLRSPPPRAPLWHRRDSGDLPASSATFDTDSHSNFTKIIPITGLSAKSTYYLDVLVNGVSQLAFAVSVLSPPCADGLLEHRRPDRPTQTFSSRKSGLRIHRRRLRRPEPHKSTGEGFTPIDAGGLKCRCLRFIHNRLRRRIRLCETYTIFPVNIRLKRRGECLNYWIPSPHCGRRHFTTASAILPVHTRERPHGSRFPNAPK
jgi:hypothetical protein